MSLSQQFQIIIFSFLFGIFFLASYQLFNTILYKLRGSLLRFVLEMIFFGILVVIYFFIIFFINDARLSIYLPIFIFFGALFYHKFFSYHLLVLYEKFKRKYDNQIKQIRLFFFRKFSIIKIYLKKKGSQLYEKIRRKQPQKKR